MALIKSISGIRGTIGGAAGTNLTPQDIVECTAAFGYWLQQQGATPKVVIGRDARISGKMVSQLVSATLNGLGIDVVDLGLSTTPTVEVAVPLLQAGAGIIITASHNPKEWNALKFINKRGEFISKSDGETLLQLIESGAIRYAEVTDLGSYEEQDGWIERHIDLILDMDAVDADLIRKKAFKVVVDPVNSTGAIAIPALLDRLGCETILINGTPDGFFAHNPEPLPKHLEALSEKVKATGADMGISVDPDVDRLALVSNDGSMFGEEYTLVAVADYLLQRNPGNTVSNLSSTRALRDVTERYGGSYFASAVGEVNVVEKMKAKEAVIGGEGNGGVIVPVLHYGRDALAGIALILTHLAKSGKSMTELRATYPDYQMVKDKIQSPEGVDLNSILEKMHEQYREEDCNTIDGLKIDFPDSWVHLRRSNTEPIIRIYAEAPTLERAEALVGQIKTDLLSLLEQ
ncbi:phosphoglucosamine mutase [Flavilitoribacter nigricans]|uniref:Phosphoglucosamine mutase n=1 Tax=Flavilitoribacter nigricans (strain ATCC 23147 / DSM 23189 / NBRC 102662 / NCIMB 1420 / SS-2) TaxID=1122177 RepID=A0A2D0NJ18_FLAN2|nr:phosphoglucosamine mutase [Flavilitoribacter nigricans]PHN08494.1 phosphoglucosamine mutase [Flavilitoribacter nigricans DSM 23189 = NBRC 102662]